MAKAIVILVLLSVVAFAGQNAVDPGSVSQVNGGQLR
jgi:endonuclease V-like protein UPF0215 family